MLPALKQLWQTCFGDSAAGTDFVFNGLLRPERMLVKVDDAARPVAMLCWQPLTFHTQSAAFDGAYIFGVGTLPSHRGKGISTALLEKAESTLRGQGVRLSCLVPASESLFDFYGQRGFGTQFYYKLLRVGRDKVPATAQKGKLAPVTLEDLEEERYKTFGRSLFGAWDKDYLRYTALECHFWGGEVERFTCEDMTGYAVCYPDGNGGILIKETSVPALQLDTFLAALHQRYNAQSYQLRLPVDFALGNKWSAQTLPFAMTKWYYKEDAPIGDFCGAPWFAFGLDG